MSTRFGCEAPFAKCDQFGVPAARVQAGETLLDLSLRGLDPRRFDRARCERGLAGQNGREYSREPKISSFE